MNFLRPVDRDVVVNGLKLHVLDWGGAGRTPLLLLHGFTGHAHAWDTLSIALQPHFHVYAMDQRGHGDSDPAEVYNAIASFDDISGVVDQLALPPFVLVGLSMGGRNGMYFTSKRADRVQKLVIVDIGPEISKRAAQPSAGPPEPDTWESIEQAAQHLYRGNAYPGIHYYRWVASTSLRQRPDGALVWKWHPEREGASLRAGSRLVGHRALPHPAHSRAARRIEPHPRSRRGGADGARAAPRPLRGDPARRAHAPRRQSRGCSRRPERFSGLLTRPRPERSPR